MVVLSTFGLLLTWFFFFGFLYKFDMCMIEKSTILVICIHKRVKSIVFAVSIKLFCDESGLAIKKKSLVSFFSSLFVFLSVCWSGE